MAVAEAARSVMVTTATTWGFRAADAVEAVIHKIVSRSPLTFVNPHLGTVLRVIAGRSHGHPARDEPTAVMWKAAKKQQTAMTGSSSYVTEVTGKFSSLQEATIAWQQHYEDRKQCPLRNHTIADTLRGTCSEVTELKIEIDKAQQEGLAATRLAVMDEAGDVWYGAQCYIVAYKEQCQRAIMRWTQQVAYQASAQSASAQTDPDMTRWVTPTPSPEVMLAGVLLQVEQVVTLAESDADASQITATVRTMAEAIATATNRKAGTLMQMAAESQQSLYRDTAMTGHGMTEQQARQSLITNSRAESAQDAITTAMAQNHSWEGARDMLIKTMMSQKAASCPNWNRESAKTAQLVIASAKALQQEINGSRLATSSPCRSINESQVLMAVSRLIRRAVQHSIADTVTEDVPAKPAHIRFAASAHEEWHECQDHQEHEAHNPNDPITTEETGSYHSHSGHEVKEDEEADIWHDCHQQKWSAAQHIRQARYPSMTNSEAQ